jgi:type I restriction enzyme S subunit
VARIGTGSRNNQDKSVDGDYPFFVRSQEVERIGTFTYDCEAILIPGEGNIGKIYHYINGKFEAHQRVYVLRDFHSDVECRYIHLFMRQFFERHAMANTVKATVDSLRRPTFESFEILLPASREEQRAIADAISDLENEEACFVAKRSKLDELRQGMMQQLLTGRIRLV